ncbi:MAG: TrmH family RNA methyltransferase [Flavobacterium sp.]
MVSKNQIKFITSLQQKKHRIESGFFIAEGNKIIFEFIDSGYSVEAIYSISDTGFSEQGVPLTIVSQSDLKKMSALVTPNESVGVFQIPIPAVLVDKGFIVALDSIRDPGNLGTIIRLCDWFGITQLVCSKDTVDVYNPKVIQATMGSLARVNIFYQDLEVWMSKTKLPVLGAFMDGCNVYASQLPQEAILVMGNEANGISSDLEQLIKTKISIPRFGEIQKTESLNVATATAILLSEFRRNS